MTNSDDRSKDPTVDDHDEEALDEASQKMLLRDKEAIGETEAGHSSGAEEHDQEALAEAERKMLLREDRT